MYLKQLELLQPSISPPTPTAPADNAVVDPCVVVPLDGYLIIRQ